MEERHQRRRQARGEEGSRAGERLQAAHPPQAHRVLTVWGQCEVTLYVERALLEGTCGTGVALWGGATQARQSGENLCSCAGLLTRHLLPLLNLSSTLPPAPSAEPL